MRLVIAQCTVDYVGRLTAHLPSARRLLLFKADGSVSVHADDRAYKPLNWMSPPCWVVEDPDGESPVWVVENKAGEQLRITVEEIEHDYEEAYPEDYGAEPPRRAVLVEEARARWRQSRTAYRESLEVTASVVSSAREDSESLDRLIADSQSAVGNLQVAQAGNQIEAMSAQQLMQMEAMMASHYRAEALEGLKLRSVPLGLIRDCGPDVPFLFGAIAPGSTHRRIGVHVQGGTEEVGRSHKPHRCR